MTSLAAWLPSTYATSNVPALTPSSDASTSTLRAFHLRTGFGTSPSVSGSPTLTLSVPGVSPSSFSRSASLSDPQFGSTPVTRRTLASNRASTAAPLCRSPLSSKPRSAYWSPPRQVSTQCTALSRCLHSAQRSHCVPRPSQQPISSTLRGFCESFIHPSWVNTRPRESALCVNQLVVNSLPSGSVGSVVEIVREMVGDVEPARRGGWMPLPCVSGP